MRSFRRRYSALVLNVVQVQLSAAWKNGGVEGVRSNPPFGLQIILYAPPNRTFLSTLLLESGPLVLPLLRITAVQTSLVELCEFVHGKLWAQNTSVIGLRHCDERTRVNICKNKSLFQVFESSPVVLLVMLPTCCSAKHSTFSHRNSKSAGLANAHGQPKIWCNYPQAM